MAEHASLEAEVVVVGAGASGAPAAIAAARAGAKVALVEEDAVIGGAPSDYYVCMFYGGTVHGILAEVDELLAKRYATAPGAQFFTPESWQRAFWHLLREEENVRVIPGARAVGVIEGKGGGTVAGVICEVLPGRSLEIRSKVTIDATGSGIVSELAGCRARYGRDARREFGEPSAPAEADEQVQHCTWMYFAQRTGAGKPLKGHHLEAGGGVGILEGIAPRGREAEWEGIVRERERQLGTDPGLFLFWGCSIACRDTRDPIELARTQTEALGVMERDHALLREHGYAIYLAPRIGVRECRRIVGEYVITENDLRAGEFPEDTIAACDYGLDIWDETKDCERGLSVARYGIPYRALVPRGVEGLLMAGKCISGTHIAMSSHRVMPIAGKTGQAAGVAAALAVKGGRQPREVEAGELREALAGPGQHLAVSWEG